MIPWCWDDVDFGETVEAISPQYEVPQVSTELISRRAIRVQKNQVLRVRYISYVSGSIDVRIDIELADGTMYTIRESMTLVGDHTHRSADFPLVDGMLVGCTVWDQTIGAREGEIFVSASVHIDTSADVAPDRILFADYLVFRQGLSWPQSGIHSPVSGSGRVITETFSVMGTNVLLVPYTHSRVRVLSLSVDVTTGASVGNRQLQIVLYGRGKMAAFLPAQTYQTASQVIGYHFQENGGRETISLDTYAGQPRYIEHLPSNIVLDSTAKIAFILSGALAGDKINTGIWTLQTYFEWGT